MCVCVCVVRVHAGVRKLQNVPVCYCCSADEGYDSNAELNSGSSCHASGACQNLLAPAAAAPDAASARKCTNGIV